MHRTSMAEPSAGENSEGQSFEATSCGRMCTSWQQLHPPPLPRLTSDETSAREQRSYLCIGHPHHHPRHVARLSQSGSYRSDTNQEHLNNIVIPIWADDDDDDDDDNDNDNESSLMTDVCMRRGAWADVEEEGEEEGEEEEDGPGVCNPQPSIRNTNTNTNTLNPDPTPYTLNRIGGHDQGHDFFSQRRLERGGCRLFERCTHAPRQVCCQFRKRCLERRRAKRPTSAAGRGGRGGEGDCARTCACCREPKRKRESLQYRGGEAVHRWVSKNRSFQFSWIGGMHTREHPFMEACSTIRRGARLTCCWWRICIHF